MDYSAAQHPIKKKQRATHPDQHPHHQKSPTLAWDAENQVIGRNGVQKPISQTKMTTEGNSICFSVLNDLSTIPFTLTETLESKNYEYKPERKHISVKSKLNKKYEFW